MCGDKIAFELMVAAAAMAQAKAVREATVEGPTAELTAFVGGGGQTCSDGVHVW